MMTPDILGSQTASSFNANRLLSKFASIYLVLHPQFLKMKYSYRSWMIIALPALALLWRGNALVEGCKSKTQTVMPRRIEPDRKLSIAS